MRGNCVDKFISNRVNKRLTELLNTRLEINIRIDERDQSIDYFNSLCYEKDFSDIIELRNIAQQLVDNCNTFLERISDQYSKLE